MSVSVPLMTASHMNFHPGADISAHFLLKRHCVRLSQPKRHRFVCLFVSLQENKLIKGYSWVALARLMRRCGREGKDKRCGVFAGRRVVRGPRSDVWWQRGATVLTQLASPGFLGLERLGLDYLQARPQKKKKQKMEKSTRKTTRETLLWRPFNWICTIIY